MITSTEDVASACGISIWNPKVPPDRRHFGAFDRAPIKSGTLEVLIEKRMIVIGK